MYVPKVLTLMNVEVTSCVRLIFILSTDGILLMFLHYCTIKDNEK